MATVEDIIKVIENNGVPMSKGQLLEILGKNEGENFDKIVLNSELVKISIETYLSQRSGNKYNIKRYFTYWTKNELVNYIKFLLSKEVLSKSQKFTAQRVINLLLSKLGALIGSNRLSLESGSYVNISLFMCRNNEANELIWSELSNEDITSLLQSTGKYFFYKPSIFSKTEDYIIIQEFEKEVHEMLEIFKIKILKILRKTSSISLKNLIFELNNLDFQTILPKPYHKKAILDILEQHKSYFNIEGETVSLRANFDLVALELQNSERLFERSLLAMINMIESKILAISFSGINFPFEAGKEYVKLRKIIFLLKISPEPPFGKAKTLADLIMGSELFGILNKLLRGKQDAMEWLLSNTTISIYADTSEYIEKTFPLVLEKLSPIFNLTDNPGNLFAIQLRELLESKDDESKE